MTLQKMLSLMRKGVTQFNMIEDGDKIAVGISGGKDSLTLLKLLAEYRLFSPQKFTLVAITVDLAFNGKSGDYRSIQTLCDELKVDYIIEKTQIGEVVFDVSKETNPCALCSKMRKGALNECAKRLGCNKVALGHHADDLIDTFFLSLFYEGRLSTFSPVSYLDKVGLTLIRPMVYIEESDVKSFSTCLPVMKSACPVNKKTHREVVKDIVKKIGADVPNIRQMVFTALLHPERNNLLDRFLKPKQ